MALMSEMREKRDDNRCFVSEILQFKSDQNTNKQILRKHDEAVVEEKPEPIMVDRNQYSMGGESGDDFNFNARKDDTNSAVKSTGFEFRYLWVFTRLFFYHIF